MSQTISKYIGEGFGKGELYAALAYDETDTFGGMRIKGIYIAKTSALTTGTIRAQNVALTMTVASTGNIVEALYVSITSNVKTGAWANAITGKIDYSTAGAAHGMAAAICAEMIPPNSSLARGALYALDLEFGCGASSSWASAGPLAFIKFANWGTKTHFDDNAFLFHLTDVTSGTGHLLYNNTIRLRVGTTSWYMPLSTAEASYTSAYPVVLTYAGEALTIDTTIANTATIVQTITVTDSGTLAAGRNIGLFIDYVVSGTKTSAFGIRPLRINTQVLANVPSVQVADWYLHTIDNKTIDLLFGLTMYWEDVGDNIGSLCMIDLGKNMTHTASTRDCFIRCREHTGVQTNSSILRLEGTNAAAFLVDFEAQAGTGQSILATGSDTTDCTYKIAIRLSAHSVTKYIHLFDS